MKTFRAKSGPFEEQLRFSVQEIDRMCLDALKVSGLLPNTPEAVRIERFIEKHFECLVSYEDLGEGVMGCTVFRENGKIEVVVISSRLDDGLEASDRRVRSTLAHEAGHCLMHPSLFIKGAEQQSLAFQTQDQSNLDFKKRRIMCRDSDVAAVGKVKRYDGRWWEWQANRAIGGLLLPAELVMESVSGFLEFSPVTRVPSFGPGKRSEAEREVSRIFEVNPVVARIRLQELVGEASGQLEF